ncbi:hypothetical protein [Roseofilum casamattae]|uniref:Uncharacterized protein n=1 Tax=Roseofilum casamattae BLCC-M143 TaxID=3022442 RepID=A0ABT7BRE5_9CYAN|nr:hypothetical protein [Roseofilum casamattae]MDJ1181655.1 hypothetical protein [Roseofilum casamattae BLCC-M143]
MSDSQEDTSVSEPTSSAETASDEPAPSSSRWAIAFPPGMLAGFGFAIVFLLLQFPWLDSLVWGLVGGISSWWIETSWNTGDDANSKFRSLPANTGIDRKSLARNRTRGERWEKR